MGTYEGGLARALLAVLREAEEEARGGLLARRCDEREVIREAQREVGTKRCRHNVSAHVTMQWRGWGAGGTRLAGRRLGTKGRRCESWRGHASTAESDAAAAREQKGCGLRVRGGGDAPPSAMREK